MTISSTSRKSGPYSCNGSTTQFPFDFKVFSDADVLVILTDSSGLETTLTSGYTVSLNANQDSNPGGTITTTATYATGYLVTLTSAVQNLQSVDLTNQGGFYPKVLNTALDRLTIMVQQVAEQVGRAVKVGISSATTPDQLISSLLTAVSNALLYANSASTSATAAGNSATAAAGSAAAAAASAGSITPVDSQTHSASIKATPVDADEIPIADSTASFGLKKLTWANLKVTVKSYIESAGLLISSAVSLGYTTGSGGAVTQPTSKSTTVTLNRPTGQITMNAAALAANTSVVFQLSNSLISDKDTLLVNGSGAWWNYRFECYGCSAGSTFIRVTNVSAGSLSDAVVMNFTVIKGATA